MLRRNFLKAAVLLPVISTYRRGVSDGVLGGLPDLDKIKELLQQGKPLTWLFTGDSITQGAKHTYGCKDYPEVFEERIRWELRRLRDVVINTGINGSNTSNLLADFDWGVGRFNPSVVFMMFGTNDCQAKEIPPEVFRQNLVAAIGKVRDLGAIPVLQTPNAIEDDEQVVAVGYKSRSRLGEYVTVIRDLAEKYNLVLVDHWSYWQDQAGGQKVYQNWLDDPLHPNAAGHAEIARLIFRQFSIFDPNAFTCSGKK